MANVAPQIKYKADGVKVDFNVPFQYLKQSDVYVSLWNDTTEEYDLTPSTSATNPWSWHDATTIRFTTAPVAGADEDTNPRVLIFRDTSVDALIASFFPGASIRAQDLNDDFTQVLFSAQESEYTAKEAIDEAGGGSDVANQALQVANAADAKADTAIATANSAETTAEQALAAISQVLPASIVQDVGDVPWNNTDDIAAGTVYSIINSTGVENEPVVGIPAGFVGSNELTVNVSWSGTQWDWLNYRANDPDDRYQTEAEVDAKIAPVEAKADAAAATADNASLLAVVNASDIATLQTDVGNALPTTGGAVTGSITTPERTITAGAFDLATGPYWTCGAIDVPNPTNAVSGMAGTIRVTAAPTSWAANFSTAPTPTVFPSIIPFYVESSTSIRLGNAVGVA